MLSHLDKPYRQSLRLRDFDYSSEGAYYVTICSHGKKCTFGRIDRDQTVLNNLGRIIEGEWLEAARKRGEKHPDMFVVMPNHFHGIIWIPLDENDRTGTASRAPTAERFGKPVAGSVPTIVRSFKSGVTRRARQELGLGGKPVWQRGFYERVIRNEKDLNRIRQYILDNPANWDIDEENPDGKAIKVTPEW